MYTLAVEIHGLRQLERLQPDLVSDIRRRVVAVMEVHGGGFCARNGNLWLFRFERALPEDRQGVLDALAQATSLLAAREAELVGWSVVLDYVDGPDAEAAAHIRRLLLPVCEDNAVWLGSQAHALLLQQMETHASAGPAGLYRIDGPLDSRGADLGSVPDLARSNKAGEVILDALVDDSLAGGMLLVLSDDEVSLRVNTRSALYELFGAGAGVRWLEAEANTGYPLAPLASVFAPLDVHETGFWLTGSALASWDERLALVESAFRGAPGATIPDARETDLLLAFELYLAAYLKRAAASLVPPVVLCHRVDRWSPAAVDALARTVRRFTATDIEPGLVAVGTATSAAVGTARSSLVRRTVRLPHAATADTEGVLASTVNRERLRRVAGWRTSATVHYRMHVEHWEGLTDSQIAQITDSDLAWRVVCSCDSELQELLLVAHYVSSWMNREQYTDTAVRLGLDRSRVAGLLRRLRDLGIVEDQERVVPCHPEHRSLLEGALGSAASTVYDHSAQALLELVDANRATLSEPIVRFLSRLDAGRHVPELFDRLIGRAITERRLDEARRLLYDVIPPRCPDPPSRVCVRDAVTVNRVRLALCEGNARAAERARNASEPDAAEDRCDRFAGDLAVQKARLAFSVGNAKEAVALLKRAIVLHQDLDDQTGLARANLDFGTVLLAQGQLLDAREYFLLGGKFAVQSGDPLEQLRAQERSLVCDFVYGNLTQSLAQADLLYERASAAGARWTQLFADLARGRVMFELGRYTEAADWFSRGRSRARLYGLDDASGLMERWLARSLIYDGRHTRGITVLRGHAEYRETALYLAEGLLRVGEHTDAIAALDLGIAASQHRPGIGEEVSWTSGYASLEDRVIGACTGTQVLTHQMIALRGYLLAESGRKAEGVSELHRLTRELRIGDIDPHNRIYFYLYSLILPESGELNVEDRATVLGKAVRYIQQRTSRMDAYEHKTDYLRRNYWNARLVHHAQAHNLV